MNPSSMSDTQLLSICLGDEAANISGLKLSEIFGFNTHKKESLHCADVAGDYSISMKAAAIRELWLRCMHEEIVDVDSMENPDKIGQYLCAKLSGHERELFCVVFLDNRHAVISVEELFSGTINSTTVHPRVVVQRALRVNASAVFFAHNHPSYGSIQPSDADIAMTKQLTSALALLDIKVLDHFIVSGTQYLSMLRHGDM